MRRVSGLWTIDCVHWKATLHASALGKLSQARIIETSGKRTEVRGQAPEENRVSGRRRAFPERLSSRAAPHVRRRRDRGLRGPHLRPLLRRLPVRLRLRQVPQRRGALRLARRQRRRDGSRLVSLRFGVLRVCRRRSVRGFGRSREPQTIRTVCGFSGHSCPNRAGNDRVAIGSRRSCSSPAVSRDSRARGPPPSSSLERAYSSWRLLLSGRASWSRSLGALSFGRKRERRARRRSTVRRRDRSGCWARRSARSRACRPPPALAATSPFSRLFLASLETVKIPPLAARFASSQTLSFSLETRRLGVDEPEPGAAARARLVHRERRLQSRLGARAHGRRFAPRNPLRHATNPRFLLPFLERERGRGKRRLGFLVRIKLFSFQRQVLGAALVFGLMVARAARAGAEFR